MKLRGSLVIEAAIIFPTVIIAMFAIIFFAYYEHDIVVLRSEVRSELIRYTAENTEGEWTFSEKGRETLFYLTYEDMKSYADVEFKILPFVSEYLDRDLTDGSFKEEYKEYVPGEFVRRIGALESLSDE